MINDTTAQVLGPDGETMVTVDLAEPPEWLDLAALRADAAAHGDTDLVATIDDLHPEL